MTNGSELVASELLRIDPSVEKEMEALVEKFTKAPGDIQRWSLDLLREQRSRGREACKNSFEELSMANYYDEEKNISCGTCIHRKENRGDCPGHRLCLVRGVPDKKWLNAGYEYSMAFRYKCWKPAKQSSVYLIVELEPELFEI